MEVLSRFRKRRAAFFCSGVCRARAQRNNECWACALAKIFRAYPGEIHFPCVHAVKAGEGGQKPIHWEKSGNTRLKGVKVRFD